MRNTHFTSFAASIIALIGVGWLVVALVIPASWENLRPLLLIGGVVVIAVAAVVFLLARRTPSAE